LTILMFGVCFVMFAHALNRLDGFKLIPVAWWKRGICAGAPARRVFGKVWVEGRARGLMWGYRVVGEGVGG
jgi:hypothetical protein